MAVACAHLDEIKVTQTDKKDRRQLAASAHVLELRTCRLLRLVAQPACDQALRAQPPPAHAFGGAGRRLDMVLRRRNRAR